VTDVKYRMSLALIRDLAEAGIRVAAVAVKSSAGAAPLGFSSRYVSDTALLPEADYENALYSFCEFIYQRDGKKPALLPVGSAIAVPLSRKEVRERFWPCAASACRRRKRFLS
jgi:hypothetical protein